MAQSFQQFTIFEKKRHLQALQTYFSLISVVFLL